MYLYQISPKFEKYWNTELICLMMNLHNIVSKIFSKFYFLQLKKYDTESVHNCLIIHFDEYKIIKMHNLAKYSICG